MTAIIIDGKKMAQEWREKLTTQVASLNKSPYLAVVLVGNDGASMIYDRNKQKFATSIGIKCDIFHFPQDISQEQLIKEINCLNANPEVNGIIVQMPLPKPLDSRLIMQSIRPDKDVDGLTATNIGMLHLNHNSAFVAATPQGILNMLLQTLGNLSGKEAVIIGRSNIVGRPLASLLLNHNCTVTIAHSKTADTPSLTRRADIVIAACGVPLLVKKDWIKSGAVVIDVGINRINGKICGDVDFDEVKSVAGYITPVPGGVGPMTVAMLMNNTIQAYLKQNSSL